MAKIDKYGRTFSQPGLSVTELELEIELHMIRKLYFEGDKKQLLQHYLNAHKYLWPEDKQHRWFLLGMKTLVENPVSVFLGPASSNKTYIFAVHALMDFFTFTNNSFSLISSTEKRSLEIKVWGRVKSLFNRARRRYYNLPGFILESHMAITTEETDDDNMIARELNSGIVCFPTGTLVDTPNGKKRIETIKAGDEVINAFGVGVVKGTCVNKSDKLVRIKISDGRIIDCTPEHPIFTARGWIKAIDLNKRDTVLSVHETMQIMREGNSSNNAAPSNLLQCGLPDVRARQSMRLLLKSIHPKETDMEWESSEILQSGLLGKVGFGAGFDSEQQQNSEMQEMREADDESPPKSDVLLNRLQERRNCDPMPSMREKIYFDPRNFYKAEDSFLFKTLQEESDWFIQRKAACESNGGGTNCLGYVSRLNLALSFKNWLENAGWKISLVSTRFGFSRNPFGGGNRRWSSSEAGAGNWGQKEDGSSKFSRVDSVEILEQASDSRFNNSDGGYTVHNLEVAGHPSYSVNGVIVHNCVPCVSGGRFVGMGKFQGAKPPHSPGQFNGILKHYGDEAAVMQPSFLDAYSNWMVNNSGDRKTFKGVMGGNPTDISDPLCTAAEPASGWDSFIDTKKTQEWTSRWYNAHVVAFDGRDSPNNDEPKNSFPFLISDGFVQLMKSTHGDDSWQFFQQAIGKPSRGMVSNRVITIGMCETGMAFDVPQWLNNEFIDIYALDPAFGGGDRCVGGRVRMGTFIDGTKGIEVFPPTVIPISLNSGVDPQDQIAQYVFDEATALGIVGENCFFDSFGRGTLHNHFGKFFGLNLPIAVDSGARPTTRPVRQGLYVTDKSGEKRLKRCDEEYSKFVTEMWFSTRESIRMKQVRGLPKNVAYEGQLRMFKIVSGNRTEIEPKEDMKERTGKSPDLYDWFAIAIEGCRQRGFEIKSIGSDAPAGKKKDEEEYFDKEVEQWDNAINAGLLKY